MHADPSQAVNSTTADEQVAAPLAVSLRYASANGFSLDVSFSVPAGSTILFGPSGAGKTTLLDCIAGLAAPRSGHIAVKGAVLFDGEAGVDLPPAKRRVGYVFQDLALFPHLSVEQNVAYGLAGLEAGERAKRVGTVLEAFRIDSLRQRKPGEISGGERQRAALARALVTDPRALLLDEPLSALDASTKSRLIEDLRAWNRSHAIPVLYVTHSRDEVFALGERVIALESGRVVAQGTPGEVLEAPRRESLAQLAGFENILDAAVTALHEEQGTMTCRLGASQVSLEAPLGHARVGDALRIGIRAGDILLATARPEGLSARNVIAARIAALEQRDVTVIVRLDCGVAIEAHVTPGARDSLRLKAGGTVWAVIKTHSCHPLG